MPFYASNFLSTFYAKLFNIPFLLLTVYTVGGTAQGAACAFPFVYKGRTYNSCTKHYHSMYWCSTTYDYAEDKKWGNCLFTGEF